MASMRGTSGLCTFSSIYTKLDEQVIRQFQEEIEVASLLELMKIKEADLMTAATVSDQSSGSLPAAFRKGSLTYFGFVISYWLFFSFFMLLEKMQMAPRKAKGALIN